MKILFFFVHPSKYYLFRHSINALRDEGHEIDVTIVTKDVLEALVQAEGWPYKNIYPSGRRSGLPWYIALPWQSFLTIERLFWHTRGKHYDLYVTDDLLAVLGKLRRTPTIMFTDDDLPAVPEAAPLYSLMTNLIAPHVTDLGRFSDRKIGYEGFHELAYLHPRYFTPDYEVVSTFHPKGGRYFMMRLVSLTATHDKGKRGMTNDYVAELIALLEPHGEVFISSERPLPPQFERHRIKIRPQDIAHALSFAHLFIGDSQTMTTEAAVLGTPSLRFNDFVGRINSLEHLEKTYGLTYGFRTDQFPQLKAKVQELIAQDDLKAEWAARRDKLLEVTVDTNALIVETIKRFDLAPRQSLMSEPRRQAS